MTQEKKNYLRTLEFKSIRYINHDICKRCEGECCKKQSCMLLPCDIEPFTAKQIVHLLENGDLSINALLKKNMTIPFLTIREMEGGVFSILEPHSSCSKLTEGGCELSDEERPIIALDLIPSYSYPNCCSTITLEDIITVWTNKNVKNVMKEVVKHFLKEGETFDEIVLKRIQTFEHDIISGVNDSMTFADKYSIYMFAKEYGYKFRDDVYELIFK